MTKRTPSRTTQAERTVNTGAIEQAALGTTAAAMVLGILAGETHGKTPPPAAAQPHHDTPAQAPGEAFHESDHAGTSGAAVSEPGPSSSSPTASSADTPAWSRQDAQTHQGADAQHAADDGAAALTAADSGGHAVTGSSHLVGHADAAAVDGGGAATASATHDDGAVADAPSTPIDIAPLMPDTSFVHDTVTGLTDNLPAIVTDATAAITELTSSLGATVDSAVQSILAVPTAAAGQLVDTVFHQPAVAAPLAAADGLIDHTPLVATVAQLSPLTLGFMGQPTTDNHDTHDGAFSALGLHHL